MHEQDSTTIAQDLLAYIEASPTAAHAVAETVRRLEAAGFTRLDEADTWNVAPGTAVYTTRNHTSLIAARIGSEPLWETGARITGAHTDFPGLRVKPNGQYSKCGYLQLAVEVYGGPLLHTWTDRDLGLAGRAIISSADAGPGADSQTMLYDLHRPLCHIPNLAPHIRPEKKEGVVLNKQAHLPPILGLGKKEAVQAAALQALIARERDVKQEAVRAFTVEPYDLQPGTLGGLQGEFLHTRSYDNLGSCHAALRAFLASRPQAHTQIIALFDNEEVGSQTMQGAGSRFLDMLLERLCEAAPRPREALYRAIARSFIVSADGAHAIHPNYAEVHEPHHHPILGGGPVVKVNANERYTTHLEALDLLQACAARAGVHLQHFVARTDVGTGSTIGPMTATRLGIRSIDVGNPMLAMHSIRETAGTADQAAMTRLLGAFMTG